MFREADLCAEGTCTWETGCDTDGEGLIEEKRGGDEAYSYSAVGGRDTSGGGGVGALETRVVVGKEGGAGNGG